MAVLTSQPPPGATIQLALDDVLPADFATPAQPPAARPRRRSRPATLSAGDRIGAWRVERELGRGGMGSVYAVTHNGFGKRAALKLCHRDVLGPQFTFETFLREARIVHLVNHPGVTDVFATGTYDGRPYLAMERLTGETLGQRCDRAPLAKLEALELLLELCDVLAAAHAAGVVHRDLKLDNVFLLADGLPGRRVKLLDWGVAHIVGEPDPMAGMIAGTLTYVAPEQIRADDLTPAADIYALGVLAWQLLLGMPPFASTSDLELIRKHLVATPPEPALLWPDGPPALLHLLTATLAKDPAARPAIAEVRHVLATAHAALRPRRSLLAALRAVPTTLRALPTAPPVDVLGRPGPIRVLRALRGRLLGGALAAAGVIASLAALAG